jgi:hypothetical protein
MIILRLFWVASEVPSDRLRPEARLRAPVAWPGAPLARQSRLQRVAPCGACPRLLRLTSAY